VKTSKSSVSHASALPTCMRNVTQPLDNSRHMGWVFAFSCWENSMIANTLCGTKRLC
jgi:hypothetical protein